MAIYVDNACISWRGLQWCHMLADSLDELHIFASELGLGRQWFHRTASYPHYDITVAVRDIALQNGALLSDKKTIITCAKKLKDELNSKKFKSKQLINSLSVSARRHQLDFFQVTDLIA